MSASSNGFPTTYNKNTRTAEQVTSSQPAVNIKGTTSGVLDGSPSRPAHTTTTAATTSTSTSSPNNNSMFHAYSHNYFHIHFDRGLIFLLIFWFHRINIFIQSIETNLIKDTILYKNKFSKE
jgi:hypothetical protein